MNDKIDIEIAEDEDLARAKAWWKENGSSIITGVAVGTAMVVGFNFWQTYQDKQTLEVAKLYETYADNSQTSDTLEALLEKNSDAVYAQLARFKAAKTAVDNSQFEQAENLLNDIINSKTDEGLRLVATLRLANVYLAQNKLGEVLILLAEKGQTDLPLMQGRVSELMADAHAANGDIEQAKAAYLVSIERFTQTRQPVVLVQLKLDNL